MTNDTTVRDKDELISKIGGLILSHPEYADNPWVGITILVEFLGRRSHASHGYRYLDDGSFTPALPDGPEGDDAYDTIVELRDLMAADTGNTWHQCLIQIWQPGPQIKVLFEYDDPTRWSIKEFSMDMSPYANSIKPPIG